MAKRKYEWQPSWRYIKERKVPPGRCQSGQYRTAVISKEKGILGVFCCPKGTKLHPRRRGCFRGGKKVARPILQALRHEKTKFCRREKAVCRRLGG